MIIPIVVVVVLPQIMNEAYGDTSTPQWEKTTFKRRQRQKLQAYQQLYIEYENIFKNTHKRHHADILAGLYKFQVQKALRTLFIIPRASPKKMKEAKLLWLQYSSLSKSQKLLMLSLAIVNALWMQLLVYLPVSIVGMIFIDLA